MIQFAGGVHAAVFASHCIHAEMDDFEIFGTRGSLRVSPLNDSQLKLFGDTNEAFLLPKADNVHLPLIEDFNQAIRGNHEPRISAVEGMKTSVLLEAAYHAAREGKVVTFTNVAEKEDRDSLDSGPG